MSEKNPLWGLSYSLENSPKLKEIEEQFLASLSNEEREQLKKEMKEKYELWQGMTEKKT